VAAADLFLASALLSPDTAAEAGAAVHR